MIHFGVLCDSITSSVSVIPIVALLVDYEMHLQLQNVAARHHPGR